MRMTLDDTHQGFKVVDDATGYEVEDVLWVDDEKLEYATSVFSTSFAAAYAAAVRRMLGQPALPEDEKVTKVSRVSVNWATREIHLNEPRLVKIRLLEMRPKQADMVPKPCDECCDESACRRCFQCIRFKTPFGEVAKP